MIIYRFSAYEGEVEGEYGSIERLEIRDKADYLSELNLASEMENGMVGEGPYSWYYRTKAQAKAALREHTKLQKTEWTAPWHDTKGQLIP